MTHYMRSVLFCLLWILYPAGVKAQLESSLATPSPRGDASRGRLVFAPCRSCHYAQKEMGHNNGPNLHRIFGKVVGKQAGFEYYSAQFKSAENVWTPEFMYVWLESPQKMFPESTMMSLGIADPQQRADLIAYLQQASVRN
jgi:cytochrome c